MPVSRRHFLSAGAAAAGGLAASQLLPDVASAVPGSGAGHPTPGPGPGDGPRRTATVRDVKHVVILMQENRSFDHYYGTLGGVHGLGDKRVLTYPDGTSIYRQPDRRRTDGGTLLPWHMDTARYNAQEAGDLDHSWPGTHEAWNAGAWNQWVTAKGEETMGYFTRTDVPWQYSLADAFTICDQYFCSIQGPTTPNRLYHWSGMIDPAGTAGGPAISNPADYNPVYRWTTYPERLQKAGISWQVYANDEVGDGGGDDGYVGDYGDNPLWLFQAYHDSLASSDPKKRQLAERGGLHDGWKPNSGLGKNLDHLLEKFIADCSAGTIPTVSWVVAPYAYSEHPQARPVDGANYANRVLKAIWSNQQLWESTVVLMNFDENDGFFDHVVPPTPPVGTAGEYVAGLPIGLGPRVPMTVISPWSRGGFVNSEVFDHTSVIRFLEVVTGVREPNISDWRRQVCGDLTSCFDFATWDPTVPALPDTAMLVRTADEEKSLPAVQPPASGAQVAPKQEVSARAQRDTPYQLTVDLAVDRKSDAVSTPFANRGKGAAALAFYDYQAPAFVADNILVPAKGSGTRPLTPIVGRYDIGVVGPDGFLRRFTGQVVSATSGTPAPTVTSRVSGGKKPALDLVLANPGGGSVVFTLTAGDFTTHQESITVPAGGARTVSWPLADRRYDLTITANTATPFSYRYAGRVGTA